MIKAETAAAAVIIALAAGQALAADWVWVGENPMGTAFYIDVDTIRRDGHMRRWWEIMDLKQPDKGRDRSYRGFNEGDCKGMKYRVLRQAYFKGQMAQGETSGSVNSPSEWRDVAPGTVDEMLLQFACAR